MGLRNRNADTLDGVHAAALLPLYIPLAVDESRTGSEFYIVRGSAWFPYQRELDGRTQARLQVWGKATPTDSIEIQIRDETAGTIIKSQSFSSLSIPDAPHFIIVPIGSLVAQHLILLAARATNGGTWTIVGANWAIW